MQEQEFSAFVDDIRTNGLRHPIFLHADGRILDGRNRYRACVKAGVEPRFETAPETDSLVRLLLSLNLHRRHLTSDQRACCAVELLPWLEKEAELTKGKNERVFYGQTCYGLPTGDKKLWLPKRTKIIGGILTVVFSAQKIQQISNGNCVVNAPKSLKRNAITVTPNLSSVISTNPSRSAVQGRKSDKTNAV